MTAPCRGGSARTATTSSCEEKTLEQREFFRLETVDHDQVLKYLGDSPEDREERSHGGWLTLPRRLRLKLLGEQYHTLGKNG